MSTSTMPYFPFPLPHSTQDAHSDSDDESDSGYTDMSIVPSIASSSTSLDFSMRSQSPAPSVLSITSSLQAQAYVQEYGRGLNNYSEVYRLPADDEELHRLERQHECFCKAFGKYPSSLPEIMADDGFEVKAVLDLGCGSGNWIMDVAREFPNASAVAVDLVPMQSTSMPPNCRSEVDDINLGLEHFYGDFNVVHMQLISSGVRDYEGLINHISHVLRPGGLIDMTEFPFCFTGVDRKATYPPPGTFEPPWVSLWMSYTYRAVCQRGGDANASLHLHEWVANHPAFEDVVSRQFWVPCSPWLKGNDPETIYWNDIGVTFRDDIKAFFKSARPLLLGSGLTDDFLDRLEVNVVKELDEAVVPIYVCIQNVYARKKH